MENNLFKPEIRIHKHPFIQVDLKNDQIKEDNPVRDYSGQDIEINPDEKYLVTPEGIKYYYHRLMKSGSVYPAFLLELDPINNQYFLLDDKELFFKSALGDKIVKIVENQGRLYGISDLATYLFDIDPPKYIKNDRRTSENPYKQWDLLSKKKQKENIIFKRF